MPRGNDPDAAADLQQRYGTTGNAEDLIAANRARRNKVVAAASRQRVADEETADLDWSSIDAPGKVIAAAVRGDYVAYVWEDELGRAHHGAQARKGARNPVSDEPSDEELAARAAAEEAAKNARIQAEAEQAKAEAAVKADEKAAKAAQKQAGGEG